MDGFMNCKEAKALGLKRYSMTKPCKYGHLDERLVSNGTCCECNRQKVKKWQIDNPKKALDKYHAWVDANPKRQKDNRRKWHQDNQSHVLKTMENYRKANLPLINYLSSKARANKLQRTPKWLTKFDLLKIKCMYSIASMLTRENKEPWHVDHIIPLRGENVSGLHVPSNLQVLPKIDNLVKGNRYAT